MLELGAGSGALAATLLDTFAKLGRDVRYSILEPSADLAATAAARARSRSRIACNGSSGCPTRPFTGVVVANEVLDALPVARFEVEAGGPKAVGVVVRRPGLRLGDVLGRCRRLRRPCARSNARSSVRYPIGYRSELCLALPAWLSALGASLERGSLLFVDYGLVRGDYYHEQRADGTLICHYRHRAHDDPFVYPGLQDISAWVDFSACADAATAAGFEVGGFTTQGQYLLSVLAALPPALAVDLASPREQSALKTLILPGEMGERFKVMLLRKNVSGPGLPGKDFRHRL